MNNKKKSAKEKRILVGALVVAAVMVAGFAFITVLPVAVSGSAAVN